MTTTRLANQLESYLKPIEQSKGYVTVPKSLLAQIRAHLKLMESLKVDGMQPAPEQDKQPEDAARI